MAAMQEISVVPKFLGYQLLGDSNMVRFAIRNSPDARYMNPLRTSRIGLCQSGLTTKGLIDLVKAHRHELHHKVIVLIGTNDVIHFSKDSTPRQNPHAVRGFAAKLRALLTQHCNEVVFLTVPPIPRVETDGNLKYFKRQRALNRVILKEGPKLKALAFHEQFQDSKGDTLRHLFERKMGRGRTERPDGIHLNKEGFEVMADFLIQRLSS